MYLNRLSSEEVVARKKIREIDAKKIICSQFGWNYQGILVDSSTNLETLPGQYPWLHSGKVVVKPDQLFGQRKKHGLVLINATFNEAKMFISEKMNETVVIGKAEGKLTHFLIEPYVPHDKEYYLSFDSQRDYDLIHFSEQGGIDIEANWNKVRTIKVFPLDLLDDSVLGQLSGNIIIQGFIKQLFSVFRNLDFSYLEINPFVVSSSKIDNRDNKNNKDNKENKSTIFMLDMVAQVDDCASFKNTKAWNGLEFPAEFGKQKYPEEKHIEELDQKSGASLKLTILHPEGKIWNILGGGGGSIIYLDMIANIGKGGEIANYGEASGNPSAEESYEYATSIISLMLQHQGKILFIVGGIANFTDVRDTFSGYCRALKDFAGELRKRGVTIFVRRSGPHYEEGLQQIKTTAEQLGVPIFVHGPEISMPKIIQIAESSL